MKRIFPLLVFTLVCCFVSRASINLTSTVTKACAAGTGQVSLTATGGVTPYQYKIRGGNYQASNVFTGLNSGSHTFYVKDNSGVVDSTVATVGQVVNITGTVDTAIQLISTSVSGGTAPYQYCGRDVMGMLFATPLMFREALTRVHFSRAIIMFWSTTTTAVPLPIVLWCPVPIPCILFQLLKAPVVI